MRISMASVFVNDQSRAKAFYTEQLGFQPHTDAEYGPGARWLSVVSTEAPEGPHLLLGYADDAALAFQQAQFAAAKPAIAFTTDDVQREYERLAARGVVFTMTPTKMPYGGTDALLDDTCGNLICLHQD